MGKNSTHSSARKRNDPRIWTPLFVSIVVLNLCVSSSSQLVSTGTPLYTQAVGSTSLFSGVLIASFIVATIIFRMLSGRFVDTYSRRAAIFIGAGFMLAGSLIPIFFPSLEAQLPARILQGCGFAAIHTAVSSCAADVLPNERLGEGIGYFGLGNALGMALGPSVAIWLMGLEYSEALSVGIAMVACVAFAMGVVIRYEKHPEKLPESSGYRREWEKERAQQKKDVSDELLVRHEERAAEKELPFFERFFEKSAWCGAVPILFMALSFSVFFSFCTMYAKSLDYANPGLFFVVAGISCVIVRVAASKIMDAASPIKILLIPVVAGCLTLLGIFFVQNEFVYYALGFGYGICIGFAVPVLSTVVIKASPASRFGAANALFFLMYDVGIGGGALLWGSLLDSFGFAPLFIGAIICQIVAYASAVILFPRFNIR